MKYYNLARSSFMVAFPAGQVHFGGFRNAPGFDLALLTNASTAHHERLQWKLCRFGNFRCVEAEVAVSSSLGKLASNVDGWRWGKRQKWTYYCWWLKSCTAWDVWNPINKGKSYLSTGAGFQPSTVSRQFIATCSRRGQSPVKRWWIVRESDTQHGRNIQVKDLE